MIPFCFFVSFCTFIVLMQCLKIWKNRFNRLKGETGWFNRLFSYFLTVIESVEPWLKNLTNLIFVQVFKLLQWWHFLCISLFISFFHFVFSLQWSASSIGWKRNDPIYRLVWFWLYCSLIERDWNKIESGWTRRRKKILLFWSSDTTMTEPVEPWLENLTNSIFVQVFKPLQWWHYFNYSEYCYLWKL